jgi:hypothetical protein
MRLDPHRFIGYCLGAVFVLLAAGTLALVLKEPGQQDLVPIPRLLAVDKIYHLDGTQPCLAMFWDDGHVYTASPNDLTTWTLAAHVTPHQENP